MVFAKVCLYLVSGVFAAYYWMRLYRRRFPAERRSDFSGGASPAGVDGTDGEDGQDRANGEPELGEQFYDDLADPDEENVLNDFPPPPDELDALIREFNEMGFVTFRLGRDQKQFDMLMGFVRARDVLIQTEIDEERGLIMLCRRPHGYAGR